MYIKTGMVPVDLAQRRWMAGEGGANVTMVSTAHVWIVGFSILMDGRSMGGVQHRWIEERLEEKGAALMASNAHAVFVVLSTPPAAEEI